MARYKGFRFSDASYTPDAVWFEKHSVKEYRAEYSRLYGVLQKRLGRLEKAGRTSHQEYLYAKKYIKPLKDIKSERDLGYGLSDLHKLLLSPGSSIRGLHEFEKKVSESLKQNWGFTSITPDKVEAFGQYMDYLREQGLEEQYGSGRIAELFAEAASRGVDPMEIAKREEDFNYFAENLDAFADAPKHRKEKYKNLDTYRKDIERIKRKRSYE